MSCNVSINGKKYNNITELKEASLKQMNDEMKQLKLPVDSYIKRMELNNKLYPEFNTIEFTNFIKHRFDSDDEYSKIGSIDDYFDYLNSIYYNEYEMLKDNDLFNFTLYKEGGEVAKDVDEAATDYYDELEAHYSISNTPPTTLEKATSIKIIEGKLSRIYKDIGPDTNTYVRAEKISYYQDKLEELKKNTASEGVNILKEIALYEIQIAKDILKNDSLTAKDLNKLEDIANSWINIRRSFSADLQDADLIDIEAESTNLLTETLKRAQEWATDSENTDRRFNIGMGDVTTLNETNAIWGRGLDASNSNNVAIRELSAKLSRAVTKVNQSFNNKLLHFKELLNGVSQSEIDQIYQIKSDGTINRNQLKYYLKPEYVEERSKFYKYQVNIGANKIKFDLLAKMIFENNQRVDSMIEELIRSGGFPKSIIDELVSMTKKFISDNPNITQWEEVALDVTRNAYNIVRKEKAKWESDNIVTLDPIAFHPDTSKEDRDDLLNKFINSVGHKEFANSRIRKAERLYKKYLQNKIFQLEFLNQKYPGETDRVNEEFKRWEYINSPHYSYAYNNGKILSKEDVSNIYKVHKEREYLHGYYANAPKQSSGFYDPSFDSMRNNPKIFAIYSFVKEHMDEARNVFPSYVLGDTQGNAGFVVRARASLMDIAFKQKEYGMAYKKFIQGLYADNWDPGSVNGLAENGQPIKNIPVSKFIDIDAEIEKVKLKLENLKKNKGSALEIEVEEAKLKYLETSYSTNILDSMKQILYELENYKEMINIESEIKVKSFVLNKANTESNGIIQQGGPSLELKRLNYTIDSILYGKYRDKGVQSQKIFGDTVFPSSAAKKRASELKKAGEAIYQEYVDIIEKENLGEVITDREENIKKEFRSILYEYQSLGGKRTTEKTIVSNVVQAQQIKSLGFNPISAINNLLFGLISNFNESMGGRFYNFKQFRNAFGIMLDTTKHYVKYSNSDRRQKISNYLIKNDILFELLDHKYGREELADLDKAYAWLKSGDFFMKGVSTVAALMNRKIQTANGEMPMWDVLQSDGEINRDLFTKDQLEDWDENGKYELAEYIKEINKKIHGNVDPSAAVLAKNNSWGMLLSQFKLTWLLEGAYSRWGGERYSEVLGMSLKGRYNSLFSLATDADTGDIGFKVLVKNLFNFVVKGEQGTLSDLDYENMKRNKAELLYWMSMIVLGLILKSMFAGTDDDDDKAKRWALRGLMNTNHRLIQDIQFYINPMTLADLVKSPVPAISLLSDTWRAGNASIKYINSGFDDEKGESALRASLKAFPGTRVLVTTHNFVEQDMSILSGR